jgi:hypothetical protein
MPKKLRINKEHLCQKCQTKDGTFEPHTCPYAEEINHDLESECNCCDDCSYECQMSI